jgi:4-amino-4-deoxy-L-arabinose transferase-like glycosyltransferase
MQLAMGVLVAAVFAAGFALRLWFFVSWRPAFLGFYDAGSYVATADGGGSPVRPIGYPIFLRAVHAVSTDLTVTIALQHLLGLATAWLLYAAVHRATGSRLAALVPAVVVLFDGLLVVLEHTLLSETLFVALVAAGGYAAVRSLDGRLAWAGAAGAALAAAGVTRPVGLLLLPVPVLAVLLWRSAGGRERVVASGTALVCALATLVVYLGLLAVAPGDPEISISPSGGRVLYSRVAPFADCRSFDPPAGTRALCETRPASERPGTNEYLWVPTSPAWRSFGPPPGGDGELRAFALAAIRHQPGDYVSAVWRDFRTYVRDYSAYIGIADNDERYVVQRSAAFYSNPPGVGESNQALLDYAGAVYTSADWPMFLMIVLPAISLIVARGRARQAAAIFAAIGWILLVGAVAAANYDPRYGAVAIGPLAAATGIGIAAAPARWAAAEPRSWRPRRT